jgi:hypothetical protein
VDALFGFLVQFGAVAVQDLIGVVVRGEEAHVVHLCPALLLIAEQRGATPEEVLEG